jgi:hypothetical protein
MMVNGAGFVPAAHAVSGDNGAARKDWKIRCAQSDWAMTQWPMPLILT